jgi:hypothetical protein
MQVQQRMHLHRTLVLAKLGPGKQGETEIDGGRIERIETVVQIHAEWIVGVKRPGDADQMLSEVGEDTPVVGLVRIRQCRPRNTGAKSHVVESAAHRPQAGLDIAEALAISELSESHRQILVPA